MEFIKKEKRECVKLINWYQRLMYHRYGVDELYYFLFKIIIILVIMNLFFSSQYLHIGEISLLSIMVFRKYSKNRRKRNEENTNYLLLRRMLKKKWEKRDTEHIYKKCQKCKTILRLPLPSTRGVKHTRCPKCKRKMKVLCLKKQQVEIIKKGVKINI